MGAAKNAWGIFIGRNLLAVDATCARLMGIDPYKIKRLFAANGKLGPLKESSILQHGEGGVSFKTNFQLLDHTQDTCQLRFEDELILGSISVIDGFKWSVQKYRLCQAKDLLV